MLCLGRNDEDGVYFQSEKSKLLFHPKSRRKLLSWSRYSSPRYERREAMFGVLVHPEYEWVHVLSEKWKKNREDINERREMNLRQRRQSIENMRSLIFHPKSKRKIVKLEVMKEYRNQNTRKSLTIHPTIERNIVKSEVTLKSKNQRKHIKLRVSAPVKKWEKAKNSSAVFEN